MKDIISTLQSRIAKRARFMNTEVVCVAETNTEEPVWLTVANLPHHPDSIYLTADQKTDKRALAEIIRLRRELKERDMILDRFHRGWEV